MPDRLPPMMTTPPTRPPFAATGPVRAVSRRAAIAAGVALGTPLALLAPRSARAQAEPILRVGPGRSIQSLAQAARSATDGTIVEVDAGRYEGDVAVWTQNNLTLRAIGGPVQMVAAGEAAEGKAIWVFRGAGAEVDGFEFSDTRVRDRNGAGIRLEAGELRVHRCRFLDNENGILTANHPRIELSIEDCEFGRNGFGDGQSHNLYAGAIARLVVRGSWFHDANVGHLLKSRAAVSDIRYNLLADSAQGRASYELEFPSGGVAYAVGNIIVQGARTENPHLVSYGAEGYRWADNALYLVHNTLVDLRPAGGVFLRVAPGGVKLLAMDNLLAGGAAGLVSAVGGELRNNPRVELANLVDVAGGNYRVRARTRLAGRIVDPGMVNGAPLAPDAQYTHPVGTRRITGALRYPGAVQ